MDICGPHAHINFDEWSPNAVAYTGSYSSMQLAPLSVVNGLVKKTRLL